MLSLFPRGAVHHRRSREPYSPESAMMIEKLVDLDHNEHLTEECYRGETDGSEFGGEDGKVSLRHLLVNIVAEI